MKVVNKHVPSKQTGFTLIELVIVIVIIGILSAVAVPKMSNVSDQAVKASNSAILGAVKSAWSAAYAVNYPTTKQAPSIAEIAAQTSEPVCSTTNPMVCGTLNIAVAVTASGVASPKDLTCTPTTDCM